MTKNPSLAARALLAGLFMIGFYVLALGTAAVLVYLPYAEWHYAGRIHFKLAAFGLGGAAVILWSIIPRVDRFESPGPVLRPEHQRRLCDQIGKVATATAQQMPAEVYLVPDLNAWVAQRGGIMGFGSRRVMGLGLPLLSRLTIAQFSAVLAHEFGHYYGGDTALGPWIHKTRAAIGRTLENMAEHSGVLTKIFEWYGLFFVRLTHAVSRAQEFSADALAARVVGSAPLAEGLKVVHGAGPAFAGYWSQEYVPALQSGFRPPFQQGFQSFVASESVAHAIEEAVTGALTAEAARTDPYDTHPPLRERVDAVGNLPTQPGWGSGEPAVTLVEDVERLEKELVDWIVGPENAPKLEPIQWKDVGKAVWGPHWRTMASTNRQRLQGATPLLPVFLKEHPASLAVAFQMVASPEHVNQQHLVESNMLFGAAVATALLGAGWDVKADPGEPVSLIKGSDSINPFAIWPRITKGELTREDWKALCERTGIAALELDRGLEKTP